MSGPARDHGDQTTLPPASATDRDRARAAGETLALSVLWSRDEPHRIGEILPSPPSGDPRAWVFGRGRARPEDGRRLALYQQRPGVLLPMPPLACPRISRAQLKLLSAPGGALTVENVGSCVMLHNGNPAAAAELAPGDTLALRSELLFLVVRRAPIPAAHSEELTVLLHPFGAPDAAGIVGESAPTWELRQRIVAVARQRLHVVILGASGSGKELVARAIHALSDRRGRALVARNAATIPEGLADAELFGNVRNYPNAGMPERPGLVGQAHESTLFLDEFAELPQGLQTHLLRVMDDGEYQRLGEATTRRADLRVVAATNRPASEIKHDVLARLKIRVHVPDLDVRREDIPLLAAHLVRRHGAADPVVARRFFPDGDLTRPPRMSPTLIEALVKHRYTGHIRELDALLVQALLESRGEYVELGALGAGAAAAPPSPSVVVAPLTPVPFVALSPPPVPAAATDPGFAALTREERTRLALLRRHRFSPTACGRDPAYPGNRQTADLHLRHFFCRALALADWDVARAAALLVGLPSAAAADADAEVGALFDKLLARLRTFLRNLRARVASEPWDDLRAALLEEWKGAAPVALALAEALRDGKVVGEEAAA